MKRIRRMPPSGPVYEEYGANRNTHPREQFDTSRVFNENPTQESVFGPPRKMAQYAFTGGTAPVLALPANYRRAYLIIQNKSAATNLFIGFGSGADATTGLLILPNGGNILCDDACPTDDIYIFFTGGAAQLCVICEGVIQ